MIALASRAVERATVCRSRAAGRPSYGPRMKSSASRAFGCLLWSALLAFPGCSDDDEHEHDGDHHADAALVCQVMGELCHAADSGEGAAHECHETGHVGDGAACEAVFGECMDVCLEDDDAGAGGAGAGGASGGENTEKDPYCAALGELCHAVDDMDGPTHECHELGHVNDAEQCSARFDECATLCLEKREEAETAP